MSSSSEPRRAQTKDQWFRLYVRTGEASRFAPITRLGFVVTFLLAALVFREELTAPKGAGVLLAVGAVILLSSDL